MDNNSNVPVNHADTKRFLDGPISLLAKLKWEVDALEKSMLEPDMSEPYNLGPTYHAFNCAISAWHLTDWVWQWKQKHVGVGGVLAGFPAATTLKGFQEELRRESDVLKICCQVATGSKHMVLDRTRPEPELAANIEFEKHPARVGQLRAGQPIAVYVTKPIFEWKGEKIPAEKLFREAYEFWLLKMDLAGILEK